MTPQFDAARKAQYIAIEKANFLAATVGFVMVKTAPWGQLDDGFGTVNVHDIHEGRFTVSRNGGTDIAYPDIDAMLEDWVGD